MDIDLSKQTNLIILLRDYFPGKLAKDKYTKTFSIAEKKAILNFSLAFIKSYGII